MSASGGRLGELIGSRDAAMSSKPYADAVSDAAAQVAATAHYHDKALLAASLAASICEEFGVGSLAVEDQIMAECGLRLREPDDPWEEAGLCAVRSDGRRANEYTGHVRTIL